MISGMQQAAVNVLSDVSSNNGLNSPQGIDVLESNVPKEEFSLLMSELSQSNITVKELEALNINQFKAEDGSIDVEQLVNFLRQSGQYVADKTANVELAEEESLEAQTAAIVSGEQQVLIKSNQTLAQSESIDGVGLNEKSAGKLAKLTASLETQTSNANKDNQGGKSSPFENEAILKGQSSTSVDPQSIKFGETTWDLAQFDSKLRLSTDMGLKDNSGQYQINKYDSTTLAISSNVSQTMSSTNPIAGVKSFAINQSIDSAQWMDAFNEKVMWMSKGEIKSAAIKLNPIELGPIEISINMGKENTTIQFNSHSPQVREMIEQAVPKLREMMSDQGVNLADVNISSNDSERKAYDTANEQGDGNSINTEHEDESISIINTKQSQGLVDYFA